VSVRAKFWSLLLVLALVLGVICALEPVMADGWAIYTATRSPAWDLARFIEDSYFAGNPRWGQAVLAGMFQVPAIAIVGTPLVIIAMVLLSMTLVRARWPRPAEQGDWTLLVCVIATAIATTPQFGAMWFLRPYCANYIYPLAVQLAWLVPYRCLADRSFAPGWRAIAIVPLGLLAGAGNEHTGIGLALAAGVCTFIGWRRDRRVRAWAIVGIAALVIGYIALLTAPGQLVRYHGLATRHDALGRVVERGVAGNAWIVGSLLAWLVPMLVIVACIAGRALRDGWLPRGSRRAIAGWLALAAVIVVTALAAPRVPTRMFVAPATMVALALGVFMVELATHRGKTRGLQIASLAIAGIVLATTLAFFVVTGLEGRERLRRLETAPPGSIICIEPYTFSSRTLFAIGDDFANRSFANRVAQMFGLAGARRGCD
jgi:hypothetical protein